MFKYNSELAPLSILGQFLKNPSKYTPSISKKAIKKYSYAFIFFGITFTGIANFVMSLFFPAPYLAVFGNSNQFDSFSLISTAFFILIFAPLVEELLFRGPLAKGSMGVKRFWLFLITFVISNTALLYFVNRYTTMYVEFGTYALLSVLATLCLAIIVSIITPIQWLFKPLMFNSLTYIQAIVFGLVHITNYDLKNNSLYYILPFLIINQLYLGFVNGFLSSKYDITKSIKVHFLNNFVAFCAIVGANSEVDIYTKFFFLGLGLLIYTYGLYSFINLSFTKKPQPVITNQVTV